MNDSVSEAIRDGSSIVRSDGRRTRMEVRETIAANDFPGFSSIPSGFYFTLTSIPDHWEQKTPAMIKLLRVAEYLVLICDERNADILCAEWLDQYLADENPPSPPPRATTEILWECWFLKWADWLDDHTVAAP